MNVKSIATKAMVAAALAVTTIAPAFANNNNQYLNNLAMQMYMQNQATSGLYNNAYGAYGSPYGYGNTAAYGGQLPGAPLYGAATRGIYGNSYGNVYGNGYGNGYNRYGANRGVFNRYWHR